jgi:hypothetical protein
MNPDVTPIRDVTDIKGGVANLLNVLIVYICVMYIEIDVIYFCNAKIHNLLKWQ